MNSLGEMLRREREARGVSLEEISKQTKIGVRLPQAIENQKFDSLPGGVFNRSFVRQYARYLGLDEEKAVHEYLRAAGGSRQTSILEHEETPELQHAAADSGYLRIVLAAVGVGALVAGVLYGIYQFRETLPASHTPAAALSPPPALPLNPAGIAPEEENQMMPESSENPSGVPAPAFPNAPAPPQPSLAAGTMPAGSAAAEGKPREIPTVPMIPDEGVSLEIAARGTVWISIIADGEKQWQGTLRLNQTRQVQAAGSIRLTVGAAGAVALLLNGRPLPPLGRSGEVRTVTITPKGIPAPTP